MSTPTRSIALLAAVLAALVASIPAAAAHEPAPRASTASTSSAISPYAEPIEALGGLTLAAYLARHQERALGPFNV